MPLPLTESCAEKSTGELNAGTETRIDAHQYFWMYDPVQLPWLHEYGTAVRRDFLPVDLKPLLASAHLTGCIAVQARPSIGETEWLLRLAEGHPFIKGVIGWVPLAERGWSIGQYLDRYMASPHFRGVRHRLQPEPDEYFTSGTFNDALRALASRGLTYDLSISTRQISQAAALVDRHPGLTFVLNDLAQPAIQESPSREWSRQMRELARRTNLTCKLSGMVTQVRGTRPSAPVLRPWFEAILEAFGADRILFGSDWPVCLSAVDYTRWHAVTAELIQDLSSGERSDILGLTAVRVYRPLLSPIP